MPIKMLKPKFWLRKNAILSYIFFPFAFSLQILINLNKLITKQKEFKIPIICIGNIFVGGTGKTPLTIFLADELKKINKKPAIIKKFYSNHKDEHSLIKEKSNSLFLGKNRLEAIHEAENAKCDLAILDDGFQDFSIKKDLNILCFNSKQLIGNGMTIPSGPLREKMSAVKRADIVIINGEKNKSFEEHINNISEKIQIFYSNYVATNIDKFKNKKLFAFAGIGNPENFFDLLIKSNLEVEKKVFYSDHYNYTKNELKKIIKFSSENNLQPVTTEKDYHRIKHFGFNNIFYLQIKLEIFKKDKFLKKINNYL